MLIFKKMQVLCLFLFLFFPSLSFSLDFKGLNFKRPVYGNIHNITENQIFGGTTIQNLNQESYKIKEGLYCDILENNCKNYFFETSFYPNMGISIKKTFSLKNRFLIHGEVINNKRFFGFLFGIKLKTKNLFSKDEP